MKAMDTQNFAERASTYDQHSWHIQYAQRLVALAALNVGDTVLDAATGTGHAAAAAAARVSASGSVIGVDISREMLEIANATHGNIQWLSFTQADATDLSRFPAAIFDTVVCSAGLLYMPFGEALREWHRVLKPGGTVGFSTMKAGSPPGARIFRECAAHFGLALSDASSPLGSDALCRTALSNAAFKTKAIFHETLRFAASDLKIAWDANLRSAGHEAARLMDAQSLSTFREFFEGRLSAAMFAEPATYDAEVLYVFGVR